MHAAWRQGRDAWADGAGRAERQAVRPERAGAAHEGGQQAVQRQVGHRLACCRYLYSYLWDYGIFFPTHPEKLSTHKIVTTWNNVCFSPRSRRIKRVAGQDTAAMDKWIRDISDLHRAKPAPTIHYSKTMPDIDNLMQVRSQHISHVTTHDWCNWHQEWPEDLEETLKETSLPLAELSADLSTHVDLVCGLLDIPRYK